MTKSLRYPFPELSPVEVQANRAAWLAALRSSNYRQARRALRRANSFCCLGVAEDVVDCEWVLRPGAESLDPATHLATHPGVPGAHDNATLTTLTRVGASRLGVSVVPWVVYRSARPVGNLVPFWYATTLVKLNDENRLTLAEIADVIELQGESWNGEYNQAVGLAKVLQRRDAPDPTRSSPPQLTVPPLARE